MLQAGEPASLVRACVALAGGKDQKHNEGGNDNANDNGDQGRAGEACSLFRWWDRRFHAWLDADWHSHGDFLKTLRMGILEGFLRKPVAMTWFFDGEIVVGCW
jgi:hypothetical protein